MLFSSIEFLYWFLPAAVLLYFILPGKPASWRNTALLLASAVFYAWGEPRFLLLMAAQILAAWMFGLIIERFRGSAISKTALLFAVAVAVSSLAYYKYANFFAQSASSLFGMRFTLPQLALPLGISFYTFQIISYEIEVYRGTVYAQKSPLAFATYVAMFPQLIAGPIVRYGEVARDLTERVHTWSLAASGVRRFLTGLAKKVLIANTLGELVEICKASDEKSVLIAWLYVVAYALHLYFDFSGYSDMAIGLGRVFGFEFPENFDYPYTSKSVTEFWRRWHMTLSGWFRDYVYIPLGGNRHGTVRQMRNILIVWGLTGLWHGAGWSFVLWGLYFGLLLMLEKFVLKRLLTRLPGALRHLYLLLCVAVGWLLFESATLADALAGIGLLFGIGAERLAGGLSLYYLRSCGVLLLIGIAGATPMPRLLWNGLRHRAAALRTLAEPIALAALLIVITAFLVDGTFNPFIYFRF